MQSYSATNTSGAQPRLLIAATVAVTVRSFLLPIARHFQEQGWRVDAIATGISQDDVCQGTFDRVWEAEWGRNPLSLRNWRMSRRIRQIVVEHGYDIVHVHTPVAAFVTRCALDGLRHDNRLQVIYTAHGFHFHPGGGAIRNRVFQALERKAAEWTDFLVVINREDLKAAKERGVIALNRLRYMPGVGVDRTHYSRSSVSQDDLDRLYAELGISASTPVLLMVAEFSAGKRHADAIRAFAKVFPSQAHLLFAGCGPLVEPMRRLAMKSGVAGRIHFLGRRNDVPVLMKASRAVVLPSRREGLPRSVLEALSMGVPVIGTRIRGTAELIEPNAGLLVDVGDIDQLAQAMQLVVDGNSEVGAMGQAGRLRSEAYDLMHILRLHEDLYDEALQQRLSTRSGPSRRFARI